jgi:hypothetical protein
MAAVQMRGASNIFYDASKLRKQNTDTSAESAALNSAVQSVPGQLYSDNDWLRWATKLRGQNETAANTANAQTAARLGGATSPMYSFLANQAAGGAAARSASALLDAQLQGRQANAEQATNKANLLMNVEQLRSNQSIQQQQLNLQKQAQQAALAAQRAQTPLETQLPNTSLLARYRYRNFRY